MSTTWRWTTLLLALAGCKTAMTVTVVSRGPTQQVIANCGDAQFRATLRPGEQAVWEPTANSCAVSLDEPGTTIDRTSRDVTIIAACQHDRSCDFSVRGEPSQPSLRPGERVVVEVRGETFTRAAP